MGDDLSIVREYLELCCNSECKKRTLTVMKDMPQYDTNFLHSYNDGHLEVVMFKSTSIKIFQTSHTIMEQFLKDGQALKDEEDLVKIYLATIGLMMTTNENHTVISIHDDITWKMLHCNSTTLSHIDPMFESDKLILCEMAILQSLLCSNKNKLNKSSSYWHLFKKMMIFVIDSKSIGKIPVYFFESTVFTSAKLHKSNYYAWSFLQFCVSIAKVRTDSIKYHKILKDVEHFCKLNQTDSSAWSCMGNMLEINVTELKLAIFEYNKYATRSQLELSYAKVMLLVPSIGEKLKEMSAWLWKSKCTSEVPYHTFGRLLLYAVKKQNEHVLVWNLMEQAVVHCSVMEDLWFKERQINMVLKRGYFTTDVDLNKDLVLRDRVLSYFNWKRLLNWHTEFIFDPYLRDIPLDVTLDE
ncbi:Ecm9p CYBJADRAFT_165760 [Cyberlindnera jadinii NRRL Y-1542]|uniref:Protein prenylyltransferase n=1 Tax=Cyberlindnera jadinii (strain ATCC 18201 / CBS 1600 / BCRC 20928 / JCM 3617 / NBRC 0987 / NRRL Y-1542) TaxID=983966 RepID=A0A1E4SAQ3_CYBJN|nr:hypothetical protein CYBJADRAFT_165760 [Cyberlindnera jadinii NRRL Y-1542]ODV76482.1 hypothetical protein CYBJADRAFT_165760 [Cyberlindnera jadinii NRRL Y-1542]